MSETSDQPVAQDTTAPGVAAVEPAATEDFSTDHLDRVEVPDEDSGEADGEAAKPATPDDDLVEVEAADGSKVKVPAKVKDDLLRHADYTRKTQELSEQRRSFEAETQTLRQQIEESRAALPEEHAKVAFLSRDIADAERQLDAPLDAQGTTLRTIDWVAWRKNLQGLPEDDPNVLSFKHHRAAFESANLSIEDGKRALDAVKKDLSAKEQARLEEKTKATQAALSEARQETGRALAAEGWDQQRFADVAQFAVNELGAKPEELAEVTDPRMWRLFHRVYAAEQRAAKAEAAAKMTATADSNLKAQASRPVEPAKGQAQPTRPRDENSTEAWMRNRQRQIEAKRAPQGSRAAR